MLSIMDAFMRRPSHDARVIGALLGESGKDGSITVSACCCLVSCLFGCSDDILACFIP